MHRFPSKLEIERRKVIDGYLNTGLVTIIVQVDVDDVDLPKNLMTETRVLLNLSRKFNLDIFEVGPFMIEASLSFTGVRHHCRIPYTAILGCITDDGTSLTMFEETVSHDKNDKDEHQSESTADGDRDPAESPALNGSHLRLIK